MLEYNGAGSIVLSHGPWLSLLDNRDVEQNRIAHMNKARHGPSHRC